MRNVAPLILITAIISAAGIAAHEAWLNCPPTESYAYSIIQVKASPEFIVGKQIGFEQLRKTHVGILKSHQVLAGALAQLPPETQRQLSGDQDPVSWLQENLQVDFRLGLELMRISLAGEPLEMKKQVIELITEEYLHHVRGNGLASVADFIKRNRLDELEGNRLRYEKLARFRLENHQFTRGQLLLYYPAPEPEEVEEAKKKVLEVDLEIKQLLQELKGPHAPPRPTVWEETTIATQVNPIRRLVLTTLSGIGMLLFGFGLMRRI